MRSIMAIVLIGMRRLVAIMKCAAFLDTGDMFVRRSPENSESVRDRELRAK
jgi:hypothetical protein